MDSIEKLSKAIETKTQLLKFTQQEADKARKASNVTSMERQSKTLKTKVEEIHDLKVRVQELMIENGDELSEIQGWNATLEDNISVFEELVDNLNKDIKVIRDKEFEVVKRDEEAAAVAIQQKKFNEELRLEEAKLEQRLKFEKRIEENRKTQSQSSERTNVKLPKLTITKFKGTPTDWTRFWGQFEAEIDASNLAQVSKFSHLKESLEPKVRALIDGLPFTTEGYERAKNILKSRYGKESEIINAYVKNIMGLQPVHGTNPNKVCDFYEKLLSNVQSLETMGKLGEVNGYVRMTLDKLEAIRGDLVRTDDSWQEWKFPQLIEALRKWTERNPPRAHNKDDEALRPPIKPGKGRNFHAKEREVRPRPCVYCDSQQHKSTQCDQITDSQKRKQHLSVNKLCFNCTGSGHRAAECRSSSSCQQCHKKHHTSICTESKTKSLLKTSFSPESHVTYPVVVVKVNGIECRALLDTGSGSSYASTTLLDMIDRKPVRKERRQIEMMMHTTEQVIEIHKVSVSSMSGDFQMQIEVSQVHRGVLLSLENPQHESLIKKFDHLNGVVMEDCSTNKELPVHLILGCGEYAKIKTQTLPRVGKPGEPIAELTKLGWTIMTPGREADLSTMFATQTTVLDYENLCRLDVLGLKDHPTGDQTSVYEEFKEQLTRSPDGWYQTGLPWRGDHPPLANNKTASLKRLDNLVKKLDKQPGMLADYDAIIKDQLEQGIVERVEEEPKGQEFYIPHKAVVREGAESSKIRIVYDASARPNERSPSLNECLETGPPLQNQLWNVLVRNRFYPVALAGDLKQAFLQVRIRELDRDVMRFHWLKDLTTRTVETLRFTRALFGLSSSPFLLGGVVEQHLENMEPMYPDEVKEIRKSLYVDDLIGGGKTVPEAEHLKGTSQTIFGEARFELHKWHSNIATLEVETKLAEEPHTSYAKEQLGVKTGESKLLGVPWNKEKDSIEVNFPKPVEKVTKREVLGAIARVYDPLGLASPITLAGKLVYRQACDSRVPWDKDLPAEMETVWRSWEDNLPKRVEVPRSLVQHQEQIDTIDLHGFADASSKGVSATVYAVTQQPSGKSQGLVAAKSRLAKKGLTIPRLELVAGHMVTNLLHNVKEALQGFPVQQVYGWLDSTVALHWIRGRGEYKQFVCHRVRKIQEKSYVQWRHVSSRENPADLGSRGGKIDQSSARWLNGPPWLAEEEEWPVGIVTTPTKESEAEAKAIKIMLAATVTTTPHEFDDVLGKWDFWTTMRIFAWVARFCRNCRTKSRDKGPLTTKEVNEQIKFWIKHVQSKHEVDARFQDEKLRLNLQINDNGLYECRGRVQGDYPLYLPDDDLFTEKLVEHLHLETLHGGVGLTMTKVRQRYWVPRLRKLAKRVVRRCHGCKRFQALAFADPPPGNLPQERTTGYTPFQVIGVDYAGPIRYRKKSNQEGKAYVALYSCSLTRAIYLDLLPNQSLEEFLHSLKRFVARRGRPKKIFSDNGKTFVAAAKWLRKIMHSEKVNNWLAKNEITWQFNLSRAPWWGGQFERLVGLMKQALYKTIGNGNLKWKELEEVMLEIETVLNNRPLSYMEDDVQMPTLTPSAMLFGQPNQIPAEDVSDVEDVDLRKRARYLQRCKDCVWSRWNKEYLKALRERHNLKHNTKQMVAKIGDVVVIKGDERNRGKWKIGIITKLFKGRDGVVRAVRLRAGQSHLERPIQHLYPLELSCDQATKSRHQTTVEDNTPLSVCAPEFRPARPRAAAVKAQRRIAEIARTEEEDD